MLYFEAEKENVENAGKHKEFCLHRSVATLLMTITKKYFVQLNTL